MGALQMLLFNWGHDDEISSLPTVLSCFRTGAIALVRRREAITSLLTTLVSARPRTANFWTPVLVSGGDDLFKRR